MSVRLDVRLWAEMLDQPDGHEIIEGAFAGIREPVASFVRAEQASGGFPRDLGPEAVGRLVASLLTGLELQCAYEPELDLDAYREAARLTLARLST